MEAKITPDKLSYKVAKLSLRVVSNILFYVFVAFLIFNVSRLMYDFTYQLYGPVSVAGSKENGTDLEVVIEKGDATMDVATKLETNLAIVNKYAFYLKAKLQEAVIMPGTYEINNAMTYDEILDVITDISNSTTKEEEDTSNKAKKEQDTKKTK